jgi:hypothetical protein
LLSGKAFKDVCERFDGTVGQPVRDKAKKKERAGKAKAKPAAPAQSENTPAPDRPTSPSVVDGPSLPIPSTFHMTTAQATPHSVQPNGIPRSAPGGPSRNPVRFGRQAALAFQGIQPRSTQDVHVLRGSALEQSVYIDATRHIPADDQAQRWLDDARNMTSPQCFVRVRMRPYFPVS